MGRFFTWAVVGWLIALSAHARVHVFVGFMADEANEILVALLGEKSTVPILAIQGGESHGVFFGKPVASYSKLAPHLVTAENLQAGDDPLARISRNLAKRFNAAPFKTILQNALASGPTRTGQTGGIDTTLSLVSFGSLSTKNRDLVVVVLNPETGRQPGLVGPYLAEILQGLGDLPEAKTESGSLHLSVFATSGGISRSVRPGDVSNVAASVFVGSEVVAGADGKKEYDAVVALFSSEDEEPTVFFRHRATSREEAEQQATHAFLNYENLKSVEAEIEVVNLTDLVMRSKTKGAVSLTASFFIGPEIKQKGNLLGLANANMEDFHVLRLRHLVASARLLRLITDPAFLPERLRNRIVSWSKEPGYARSTYEEAMLWGLKGCPLSAVPESAKWRAFAGESPEELAQYLSTVRENGTGFVLDPFFAEIASEFLNELAQGTAFATGPNGTLAHSGILSARTAELLSKELSSALDEVVIKKSSDLKIMAQAILNRAASGARDEALRADLRRILDAAATLSIPRETELFTELEKRLEERGKIPDLAGMSAIRKLAFLRTSGKIRFLARESRENTEGGVFPMETWVVNTRWDGNWGRQLRYLGVSGLNLTQQDRALYRSGLLTLGREKARELALSERRRVRAIPVPAKSCSGLLNANRKQG